MADLQLAFPSAAENEIRASAVMRGMACHFYRKANWRCVILHGHETDGINAA